MYKNITPISVYENVALICRAKGFSLKKMCECTGVSYETVRRNWKKWFPSLPSLIKIADFLCVSVDDILITQKRQDLLIRIANSGQKKMMNFSIRNQIDDD